MKMLILFPLVVALVGCAPEARTLNPGAPVAWRLVPADALHADTPEHGLTAWACCDRSEIRESFGHEAPWLICHEFCHLADRMGIDAAWLSLQSTSDDPDWVYRRDVLADFVKRCKVGHWQALAKIYGNEAIQHGYVFARLSR